ncbi:hypothetical protein Tco_1300478 [Tanacetum coccineum]
MAVLDSCPKHNKVAYLEKTKGNAEFHEIIDFLKRSSIHHALTVSPVVSTTFVEQFWMSANNKSDLLFDDADETSGENLGGHSSSDKSLSGNEGDMTLQSVYDLYLSLCAQVSDQAKEIQHLKAQITKLKKQAKPASQRKHWVHKGLLSNQGRKVAKGEDKSMVDGRQGMMRDILSTEDVLSTDKEVVSTDKEGVSYEEPLKVWKSTLRYEEQVESTCMGKEKRKRRRGVELKDIEEADRPRPTSTRSLLTLKPLPKIDPKDKGKKKIEEEDESESESDGILEAEKKFKQLESDEEMARKIQEEWEEEEERNRIAEEKATNEALIRNFDDIKARIEADRLLAKKLQEQEREKFTIEERAKFLHDTIAAQKKILAKQ